MAKSNTRQQVFTEAVTSLSRGGGTEQLTTIVEQLRQLQTLNQTQVETLRSNTKAVDQSTSTNSESGSSVASTVEGLLGFGLGLSPLISGLASLFGGGGGSSEPPPLVPFVAPLAVNVNAGISASSPGGAFAVDSAEGGLPRPVASPQITVQVQAMDSQSFLDHSNDIAMAVRQAMLQSSVLNDVIREV